MRDAFGARIYVRKPTLRARLTDVGLALLGGGVIAGLVFLALEATR